jgi:predicted nucleic acid-binding protein
MSRGAFTVTNKASLDVICDAGPLIHLDELGCLDLLADFRSVLVPEQVWQEVERHRASVLKQREVTLQEVSVVVSTEVAFQTLVRAMALAIGEQAALSLMSHHPQAILLTDDAAARVAAVTLGYKVHGSIGILLRAIRRQQRTHNQVLTILRRLPEHSTLRIRLSLLQQIIAELERSTS